MMNLMPQKIIIQIRLIGLKEPGQDYQQQLLMQEEERPL